MNFKRLDGTPGAVFSSLNQRLISFAKAKAKPVRCKACGNTFKPFADQEIASWGDMIGATTCPQCGLQVELLAGGAESRQDQLAPEGPLPQPAGSRIERHEISVSEFLYHIPATGKGGFVLLFAIVWDGFLLAFASMWFFAAGTEPKNAPSWQAALFLVPFLAVGLGMGYAALRAKYAVHLLFIGPEFIRLQRQLFGRTTNRDLPTPEVTRARQTVFYTENYRPVYGIEITAGRQQIKFGSGLEEEDKRWLCAEVREYLRSTGNPNFPQESLANMASGSTASARPLAHAIVENRGHDSLIIRIPPSGRWGAWFPVAMILAFTLVGGCIFLFSGLLPAFDTIRRLRPGAESFIAIGMLLTASVAVLTWYGALRHRYLQQRISVDRFEIRLETDVLGRRHGRLLQIREITRVDLCEIMRINGEPRHAVRVVSPKQSFWFGSTLPEEDKPAVASLLREFLSEQGVLPQKSIRAAHPHDMAMRAVLRDPMDD